MRGSTVRLLYSTNTNSSPNRRNWLLAIRKLIVMVVLPPNAAFSIQFIWWDTLRSSSHNHRDFCSDWRWDRLKALVTASHNEMLHSDIYLPRLSFGDCLLYCTTSPHCTYIKLSRGLSIFAVLQQLWWKQNKKYTLVVQRHNPLQNQTQWHWPVTNIPVAIPSDTYCSTLVSRPTPLRRSCWGHIPQPASWGQTRCFGFTFGELSSHPSSMVSLCFDTCLLSRTGKKRHKHWQVVLRQQNMLWWSVMQTSKH